jgi:regulator of replication initiation timing
MHNLEDFETLTQAIDHLREQNRELADRVTDLEATLEETETRVDTLEAETDRLHDENAHLRDRLADCEETTTRLEAATDAARKRSGANKARIEELQARELEKGAHLLEANVDPCELPITGAHLERVTKEDGRPYYRLPDSADPLDRGEVALAHGDLLPIQQLARLDGDMRRSTTSALPTRLAAKLWKARTDPTVGDNPWETGCKSVREYVKASDLKHWIRRQESGVSDTYAKKLVSRTIDALLDLSKHRLAVRKKTERKNGLSYTERRVLIPIDAEIPGEPPAGSPETADVHGCG